MSKSKVKFELDRNGVREMMQSSGIMAECEKYASAIQSSAGSEYEVSTRIGGTRAIAKVAPSTAHAYYSNLKHNTLLKALKGG